MWLWSHGTAVLSFGHGVVLFSCRFAPVRQSPTWNCESGSWPVVGVALALGDVEALCDWLADWLGDVVPDPAVVLGELGLSTTTSITMITTMAAAAATGASHLGRLR